MKKEFAGVLIFICLVFFGGLASASMTLVTSDSGGNYYDIDIKINKGWNLVVGLPIDNGAYFTREDSDIKSQDILAVFGYSYSKNSYYQFFPQESSNMSSFFSSLISGEGEYLSHSSPFWLYSNKEGLLKSGKRDFYGFSNNFPLELHSGWNFVTITLDMSGKSLNDMKGSCNLEKVYWWNSESDETEKGTNWKQLPLDSFKFGAETGDSIFGTGILVKVSSDCALGSSNSNVNPPTMPN